jgi:hypothetical protein
MSMEVGLLPAHCSTAGRVLQQLCQLNLPGGSAALTCTGLGRGS